MHKCDWLRAAGVEKSASEFRETFRGLQIREIKSQPGQTERPPHPPVDTMPPILREGDLLGNGRFRVVGPKPIGSGQFAEVYQAMDVKAPAGKNPRVAIKIEREDKTSTREMRALRDLQGCKGVARLVDSGAKKTSPFIVMQMMAANLADVRSKIPGQKYSRATTGWLGAEMVDILRGIHEKGYVHRDVKPSNVCLSGSSRDGLDRTLCLIDMGLAKKFTTEPAPSSATPGVFKGSTTYASMFAHAGEEQGPRDDMWCLLYMLAECHEGTLPWRALKQSGELDDDAVKEGVHRAKRECAEDPTKLCPSAGTPRELCEFSAVLKRVTASFEYPDYDALKRLCLDMTGGEDGETGIALDWERVAPDDLDGGNGGFSGGRTYADVAGGGNVLPHVLPPPPNGQGGAGGLNPVAKPFVPRGPPPPTRVSHAIKNPERIDPDVAKAIGNIVNKFDVEQVIAICAGCASAMVEGNADLRDPLVGDLVERCLDDFVAIAGDAKAICNAKRKRQKTEGA